MTSRSRHRQQCADCLDGLLLFVLLFIAVKPLGNLHVCTPFIEHE